MNSRKQKLIVFLIIAVVVAVAGWYFWKGYNNTPSNNPSQFPATTTISTDWKVYENTAYGYRVAYPQDIGVAPVAEADPRPLSENNAIYISEGSTTVSIEVFVSNTNAPKEIREERNRLITFPLISFAEAIRQNQVNDKNPNVKNKQVGKLETVSFAGRVAYSFTLTESFNTGNGGGYGIVGVHNYIFVENNAGQKIILHYPVEDSLSEQIKNSFEFTK